MKDFEKELLSKIEKGELTECEIRQLVWDCHQVDEIEGDEHRWQREISTIIEIGNRFFRIDWMRGLTEYQENEYWEQPYEVEPKEKTIVIKEWIKKESTK